MYKWDAEDYQKSSSAQQRWAQELIIKLKLNGNERILDVGCGDGKITAEISSYLSNGFILGIDSSSEMIELAKKTFLSQDYHNLDFKIMDFRDIDFENEFDLVFSNAALHWVKDQLPVMERIEESLKTDGYLLIQQGGRGNGKEILDEADELIDEEKWQPYFKNFQFPFGFYDPEEYNKWIKKANLKPVRAELLPRIMTYKDLESFKGWIRTTWLPYTQRVPENLREEFIDAIAARYLEKYPNWEKDGINIDMVRLEVEAKKNIKNFS
jgi:trans-aconitate methyltransferase